MTPDQISNIVSQIKEFTKYPDVGAQGRTETGSPFLYAISNKQSNGVNDLTISISSLQDFEDILSEFSTPIEEVEKVKSENPVETNSQLYLIIRKKFSERDYRI